MLKKITTPSGPSNRMRYWHQTASLDMEIIIHINAPYKLRKKKNQTNKQEKGLPTYLFHISVAVWALYISAGETMGILFFLLDKFWLFQTWISHKFPSEKSAVPCTAAGREWKSRLSVPWLSLKQGSQVYEKIKGGSTELSSITLLSYSGFRISPQTLLLQSTNWSWIWKSSLAFSHLSITINLCLDLHKQLCLETRNQKPTSMLWTVLSPQSSRGEEAVQVYFSQSSQL